MTRANELLTANTNMADLEGKNSTIDRQIGSRVLLKPRTPAKTLDFLCWFRQNVATIKAIVRQNWKHCV